MADDSLDILVRITSDTAGAREAQTALDNATTGTKRAGDAVQDHTGALNKNRDATHDNRAEVDKLTLSRHEEHGAVRGLMAIYPELGHVAHLALNPISLVVASLVGSFALWKSRVEELTNALAGVRLPDLTPLDPVRVNAAAEAWRSLAEAVRHANEQFHSADASSDRRQQQIDRETQQAQQRLDAERDLKLAGLEENKANLEPGQYEIQRAAIEQWHAAAGAQISRGGDSRHLSERERRAKELQESSQKKMADAAAIHVPSAQGQGELDAENKKLEEEGAKQAAEADKRIAEILEDQESLVLNPAFTARFTHRYGLATYDEALDLERQNRESARGMVTRGQTYRGGAPNRDALRKRQEQLRSEATAEAAEAETIRASLPQERSVSEANESAARDIGDIQSQGRTARERATLMATPMGAMVERGAEAIDLQRHHQTLDRNHQMAMAQLVEFAQKTHMSMAALIKVVAGANTRMDVFEAAIARLEAQMRNVRNP